MKIFLTGASGFIGTNLMLHLRELGHEVGNFDAKAPTLSDFSNNWIEGSILDKDEVIAAMSEFQPEVVIHLAARTECDENTTVEEGYQANTVGVANVLEAIKSCPCIKRVVMTSTQYVSGPGRLPENDEDYFPHTVYGHSKVEGEKLTRAAGLECCWCFIRPVNIWGPYHARYGSEFWKIASKGLYFHPNVKSPVRAYGYIGNVIWQLMKILDADEMVVQGKAFYVGDLPISIDKWSKGFVRGFRGKDPICVPYPIIKSMALCGDLVSKITGKTFYITSSRLTSMTQDYLAPLEMTFEAFGSPPYSLDDGIKQTVEWFRQEKGA